MIKFRKLRLFRKDEGGAVTVDWVVLTAAVVGLAAGTVITIKSATATLGSNVQSEISDVAVNTTGE